MIYHTRHVYISARARSDRGAGHIIYIMAFRCEARQFYLGVWSPRAQQQR